MKRKQPFATQTFIVAGSQQGNDTGEDGATGKSGQSCQHDHTKRRTELTT